MCVDDPSGISRTVEFMKVRFSDDPKRKIVRLNPLEEDRQAALKTYVSRADAPMEEALAVPDTPMEDTLPVTTEPVKLDAIPQEEPREKELSKAPSTPTLEADTSGVEAA